MGSFPHERRSPHGNEYVVKFVMKSAAILLLASVGCATAVHAHEDCYSPEFSQINNSWGTATIKAKRSYFRDRADKATSSYVLKGNKVVVRQRDGDAVCATYQGKDGTGNSGWIKSADLADSPKEDLGLKPWLGKWASSELNYLVFKKSAKPDWLSVEGVASGYAAGQARSDEPMYAGGFEGVAPLVEGTLGFTRTDGHQFQPYDEKARDRSICAVHFHILSPRYLMAEDSNNCGGAHISFSHLYVKIR